MVFHMKKIETEKTASAFKSMREFIEKLEEEGELQHIKAKVDWDEELSAIMRMTFKKNAPACLFANVKDSKFRVFSGGFYNYKRYGLAIGEKPEVKVLINRMITAVNNPIDPVLVPTGPCKEIIEKGDEIDLYKFPIPKWFHLDGGRYIGTVVTKDPDTGVRNVGVYRSMISDKNKLAGLTTQGQGLHYAKWKAKGKPMPFAMAIGVPPAVLAAATTRAPKNQDEYGIAGNILGAPLELVKCETVDLEVPATSEIVLEGYVQIDESTYRPEGPFGEFAGYCTQERPELRQPVHLTAVSYRHDAIYQGCSPGIPNNEETTYREIGASVGATINLLKAQVPGIKEVYCPVYGACEFETVISIDRNLYAGNVREIIEAAWATIKWSKFVIVVDDDIDIYDNRKVEWAVTTRVQPHRDVIIGDQWHSGNPADPSIHSDLRRDPISSIGSRMGIDATMGWKGFEFPPLNQSTPEMEKFVESRWKEYGFR
jgi:4-hydroxy-3-polyprenylbenzoate decarboxylase